MATHESKFDFKIKQSHKELGHTNGNSDYNKKKLGHEHGNFSHNQDELGPTWQLITSELQEDSTNHHGKSAMKHPRPNQGRRPGLGRHEIVKGLRPNGNG